MALAIAAFQDAASSGQVSTSRISPNAVYSIAQNLLPVDCQRYSSSHLRALVLQTLIIMGQGKTVAAWLHTGRLVRLARHLEPSDSSARGDDIRHDERYRDDATLFATCHLLD